MTTLLDTQRRAAATLVIVLAVALAIALSPYATGLLGVLVLYVPLKPVNDWLSRHAPRISAPGVVVGLVLLILIVAGSSVVSLIVAEAQRIPATIMQSPIVAQLATLHIGGFDLGARLAELGSKVVGWIGSSAFEFIGTASRAALNLTISCFGLYYLLLRPGETWDAFRPYIPFSAENTERLRQRFRDVTTSTLIGTGLSAVLHGVLMSLAFRVVGLPNAMLWGVVTVVFSILPVLGSGMVWGPAAIVLLLNHRPVAAVLLALWGILVIGNIDYVIRPMVSRRWAKIHPLVTLIGALVGVPYLGLLGLLIGPLAVSYFFELITMYREEYVTAVASP
jgi:predicted PurR-regulated permease PerM